MKRLKETLFGTFKKDKNYSVALGVDISSSAMKFAEISQKLPGQFFLERYHIEDIPDGAVSDGKLVEQMILSDVFKRVMNRNDFSSGNNVSLVLPDSLISIRSLDLSADLSKEELWQRVQSEAVSSFSSESIDDLCVDYCFNREEDVLQKGNTLIAITRREYVNDLCFTTKGAGVYPRIIDVEYYAFHSMCSLFIDQEGFSNVEKRISVFIDIGFSKIIFLFLLGKKIVFSKEQTFGISSLRNTIQDRFSVDHLTAIRIINGREKPPKEYKDKVFPEFMEECLAIVFRTFRAFYTTTSHSEIHAVFLSGGGCRLQGLAKKIQDQLDINVLPKVLNLFPEKRVSSAVDYASFSHDCPRMTTVLGVAIRNLMNDSV